MTGMELLSRRALTLVLASTTLSVGVASVALADTLNVGTDFAISTGAGSNYSYTTPNVPFIPVGVFNASASYQANPVSVSFSGNTAFDFPTFNPGDIVVGPRIGTIGYSSSFSDTNISGSVTFAGSFNYSLNIGPINDNATIGSRSFTPGINSVLDGNSALNATSRTTSLSAALDRFGVGFNINGCLIICEQIGSVSVGTTLGLAARETVNWDPRFHYGYYAWENLTGTLTASDTPVWFETTPGAPLDLVFPSASPPGTNYFLNALPGVRLDASLTQSQQLDFLLTGTDLHFDLLGVNIFDYHNPLIDWTLFKAGQGFKSLGNEWVSDKFWSTEFIFNNDYSIVAGRPLFKTQNLFTNTPGTFLAILDSEGGFRPVPGFTDLPPLDPVCIDGRCYALDDPALPISKAAAVPEPASWALMIAGFGFVGGAMRRKQNAQLQVMSLSYAF
jgi:PEP-CTERM motif